MLTITVASHNAQPMAQPLFAEFGEDGGTIGRAPESTLTLLDPDRKISRAHALVLFRDGAFSLRDQGSVVPVLLNGKPLGNGRESPITGGDEIRIAGYVLQVATAAGAAAGATQAAAIAAPTAVPAPAPVAPAEPAPAPTATPTDAGAAPMPEPAATPAAAADEPQATSMAAPVLSWDADAPSDANQGITTVILAAATSSDAPLPTPDAAPPPAAATVQQPQPAPARAGDDELLRALLKGAGIGEVTIPGGLTPELMHQLGELLHEGTRGLLDLLAARALTKREVRADMTVIVAKDNNPLKFAPNVEVALAQLLVPRGRGFMPPLRAVGDAYDDLRAHQLGFMEGMRSAMAMVLSRFNPESLEHQLTERSMVDSLLPANRKAKLWDMFGQLYGEISEKAHSDFHALFGQEFLRAYQAHVAKLPDTRAQASEH